MAIHDANSEFSVPDHAIDEGWWASVLADENQLSPSTQDEDEIVSVNPISGINWELARKIYTDDSIVDLYVTGFNRGGLLVEDEQIQGFVPVSHLIDLPNSASEDERRGILSDYVGRKIALKIIECDPEQERVVFSERAALAGVGRRKQLFEKLQPGIIVHGTVTNITDFGVFVDLGGQEGLIHVSELSWGRVQHPGDVLYVGQVIDAQVLQVSEENSRIALSYKRLTKNPWETIQEIYKPGDVVTGKITGITKFGAFTRLDQGVEGLIHISSMKLPDGVKDPSEVLYIGKDVQVTVIHIDAERRRIGLSLEEFE
jgi:small subunit ribosomal protein S1